MADTAVAPRVLKAGSARTAPVSAFIGTDPEAERARQVQAELEAAVADAYQRGLADGRAAAIADGAVVLPDLAAAIAAAVDRVGAEAAAQVESDTGAVFAVAAEVARWIVGQSAALDPGVLITRLEGALDGLSVATSVEIEVGPMQVEAVQAWADRSVTVLANPALGPADALVRAGAATADCRVDEAIRRAMEAIDG